MDEMECQLSPAHSAMIISYRARLITTKSTVFRATTCFGRLGNDTLMVMVVMKILIKVWATPTPVQRLCMLLVYPHLMQMCLCFGCWCKLALSTD